MARVSAAVEATNFMHAMRNDTTPVDEVARPSIIELPTVKVVLPTYKPRIIFDVPATFENSGTDNKKAAPT